MRRFFAATIAAFAAVIGCVCPSFSAGTINLSLSQQLDNFGNPLSGCNLYFFQAGTTTPQSAYSDALLTLPLPNPLSCDSAGRLPQFFLADGQIKIRLADAAGVTVIAADNLLVIGPSAGAAGGGSVDATTVLATGDIKVRYGTGALTGFVRGNGRTIGSGASGAVERANNDCQALFEYLWITDTDLAVSGGRGASANADWLANKTIVLPDYRGRFIAGLDDMGATAASRLVGFTTLGTAGGANSYTIAQGNLPAVNFSGTFSGSGSDGTGTGTVSGTATGPLADHTHGFTAEVSDGSAFTYQGGASSATSDGSQSVSATGGILSVPSQTISNWGSASVSVTGVAVNVSGSATVSSGGAGTALTVFPTVLPITIYLKL